MSALMPWQSRWGGLLDSFRKEFDDLVRRFGGPMEEAREVAQWAPRVDVEESEKEIVVKADIPGVDPKDIEVSVSDSSLILRGERKEEREEKKKDYHRVERFFGRFYRQIPLPSGAETDKISATCSKGVVTVTIPKKAEAQPKKIPIQAKD
ncbi:MAG TPA: Hsp20/alpha crystallin family protein [Gemmataceae bacterium]